jgi:hypothetical protein
MMLFGKDDRHPRVNLGNEFVWLPGDDRASMKPLLRSRIFPQLIWAGNVFEPVRFMFSSRYS